MWFVPKLTFTPALQRIIRSNRNKVELEMSELCLEVMDQMVVAELSFCINDMVCLLNNTGCKADKSQVRRIVQDIWKLTPASNTLTYLTYQMDYNSLRNYSPIKRTGRYYTATKEQLMNI